MTHRMRRRKVRQLSSGRSQAVNPSSPPAPGAAKAGGEPGDDRKPTAVGRSRKSSAAVWVPIAAAAIPAVAAIIAAALTGMFSLASSHSTQPVSNDAQLTSPAKSTSTRAPIASATQLPGGPEVRGDGSAFVADVTYPDGTKVPTGQRFVKKWEIRNTGDDTWTGRYLAPDGDITGGCTYPSRVLVPTTYPGQTAIISVPVVAPGTPQVCYVTWKMVSAAGDLYFPNEEGIWFDVNVVARLGS